jgi:peptidoglycan hydrolase-like protein with peptidoglycan-binding domain
MQPTTDRYKEIQQALADKGYFRGNADGTWNGESVDALKRFQKDQNLDPDGKIGSLSLMALGLGPKRGVAQAASEPVAPPPVAQPQP